MAARIHKTELHQKWREKIKTSMLLNRLADHANGDAEMSTTQVRAAEILLKKTMPDLSAVDAAVSVDGDLNLTHKIG